MGLIKVPSRVLRSEFSNHISSHACILLLYEEPADFHNGRGWVNAAGHLHFRNHSLKPNLVSAFSKAMDLMPNLEDLHLDIRPRSKRLRGQFDSQFMIMCEPEHRKYPKLRHLRLPGYPLSWTIVGWCPNLYSLDIEAWNFPQPRDLHILKSLRRLAFTVKDTEPQKLPILSEYIIDVICECCPNLEWLILRKDENNPAYQPWNNTFEFPEVSILSFFNLYD